MKFLRDYTATMELPQDQALEAAVNFYVGQRYEKGTSSPPTQASLVGYKEPSPGTLGKFMSAKSRQKTVELSFASKADGKTEVKCKYTLPFSIGSGGWSKVRE
jgi:hypothetical protein